MGWIWVTKVPLALVAMNWDKSVPELRQVLCQDTMPVFPVTLTKPGKPAYMSALVQPERMMATGQALSGNPREAHARGGGGR